MTTMTPQSTPLSDEREAYVAAAQRAWGDRLADLVADTSVDVADLPSPDDLVRHGIHARTARVPLGEMIGPVYSTGGVQSVLGISRQQVADRRTRGTIIAGRTEEGRWLYPVFQFDGGAARADVREVLDVLRTSPDDPWTMALRFAVATSDLGGRSPMQRLDAGERDVVHDLARRTASRWAA